MGLNHSKSKPHGDDNNGNTKGHGTRHMMVYSSTLLPVDIIKMIVDYNQQHKIVLIGGHQWKNGKDEAPHVWYGNPFEGWLPGPSLPNYIKSQNPCVMYYNDTIIVATGQVGPSGYGEKEHRATYHLTYRDLLHGYQSPSSMAVNFNLHTLYEQKRRDGTSAFTPWIRRAGGMMTASSEFKRLQLNRSAASSIVVPQRHQLHIIGGSVNGSGANQGRAVWINSHIMYNGSKWMALPAKPGVALMGMSMTTSSSGDVIYIAGGTAIDGTGTSTNVYQYDIDRQSWTMIPSLPTPRYDAASFYLDDCLYVAGGFDQHGTILSTIERFSTVNRQWLPTSTEFTLPEPLAAMTVVLFQDHLTVLGGLKTNSDGTSRTWTIPIKSLRNASWTRADLPVNVSYAGCTVIHDE